jgi:hypothetical protein
VAFPSVVVAVVRKEETILSVYLLQKLDPCQLVKELQRYQENKKLKEKLEQIKNQTTQELKYLILLLIF